MNRRGFLGRIPISTSLLKLPWKTGLRASPTQNLGETPPMGFHSQAFAALPVEKAYAFHKALTEGGWQVRRAPDARPAAEEMAIPETGWSTLIKADASEPLRRAAEDLRSYLNGAMQTQVGELTTASIADWANRKAAIIAGTCRDLPGVGTQLSKSKDYQIIVSPERILVCGYDELGAMFGLYHLEERLDLREGPFLPRDLNTTRHSLFKVRMTMSGLGWMEWPDNYLAWVPRYGFDAIFTSVYSNPDGTMVPSWLSDVPWGCAYHFRRQDPAQLKDVVRRAAQFGVGVYCQISYQYTETAENEEALRQLVRNTVTQFPEIRGYIILTEGFYYRKWFGAAGQGKIDLRDWIKNWAKGVGIVAEECHKLNPAIEVLPWDYNIDFRPSQVELKNYVIQQLPENTIPFLTWENGKEMTFDGENGYARDYTVSVVGPSEVTAAQILEARKRGMRTVYSNADTWSSQQLGTFPHLPFPYQWHERQQALQAHGIDGTLESWSPGLKPNFIAEMCAWYSWSDAPPLDNLLQQMARRDFGAGSEKLVLDAWRHLSAGIRMDLDSGPTAGGYNAVANPLFFSEPESHIMTIKHSFFDQAQWEKATNAKSFWPYTFGVFLFCPDFTNKVNMAERYARPYSLKTFTKYLLLAAAEMETGLQSYRLAALKAPPKKRAGAFREVLLAEQVQRTLQSSAAMLEFEDLRFRLANTSDQALRIQALDRMTEILKDEIARTQLSLKAAERDSRLGYEWENDYVYWPEVLEKKLQLMNVTLDEQIPACRRQYDITS